VEHLRKLEKRMCAAQQAVAPLHIEPMRMKSGDCVIASIATALQRSYEDVAATLGIALDRSGIPVAVRHYNSERAV
jgi:hypothetical protein